MTAVRIGEVEPTRIGWVLTRTIDTRLGAYGPGTQVTPLNATRDQVVICLDPDQQHPAGYCHKVTVGPASVRCRLVAVTGAGEGAVRRVEIAEAIPHGNKRRAAA